jgi:putative DNA-binding protein
MPTLLETQIALCSSLFGQDSRAIADFVSAGWLPDTVSIYRNTVLVGLTKTLRLSYPVVLKLVGEDFFEAAALEFIRRTPPQVAYLNQYGGGFDTFLRGFPPARGLSYLPDVARLEWAVNCALHAADCEKLDLRQLECIAPDKQDRVTFKFHPSVSLLNLAYPVDAIWHAVIDGSDSALAEIDIDAGPVWLMVGRRDTRVTVECIERGSWQLAQQLLSGAAIGSITDVSGEIDLAAEMAAHLATGRIVAFNLSAETSPEEFP